MDFKAKLIESIEEKYGDMIKTKKIFDELTSHLGELEDELQKYFEAGLHGRCDISSDSATLLIGNRQLTFELFDESVPYIEVIKEDIEEDTSKYLDRLYPNDNRFKGDISFQVKGLFDHYLKQVFSEVDL